MAYRFRMDAQLAAEKAVSAIRYGYDLKSDIRLSACKASPSGAGLIELDRMTTQDLVVPGNFVVPNVSASIKCDKGGRALGLVRMHSPLIRCSDVRTFQSGTFSDW